VIWSSPRKARHLRPVAFAALAALPAVAAAQRLGQGSGPEIAWWRVAAALFLCLALAAGVAFALRKRIRGGTPLFTAGPRRLQLVESLRLSHQVDVCIVRCDGRDWLIAATPHGASLLHAAGADASPGAPPQ
jgi:flagellar biogenesis protein FliO